MLLAGMVSESALLHELLFIALVWFGPPIAYVLLFLIAARDDPRRKMSAFAALTLPPLGWVVGLPLALYLYQASRHGESPHMQSVGEFPISLDVENEVTRLNQIYEVRPDFV